MNIKIIQNLALLVIVLLGSWAAVGFVGGICFGIARTSWCFALGLFA